MSSAQCFSVKRPQQSFEHDLFVVVALDGDQRFLITRFNRSSLLGNFLTRTVEREYSNWLSDLGLVSPALGKGTTFK